MLRTSRNPGTPQPSSAGAGIAHAREWRSNPSQRAAMRSTSKAIRPKGKFPAT